MRLKAGDEFVCRRSDFVAHDQYDDTAFAQVARDAVGENAFGWTVGTVDQTVEALRGDAPLKSPFRTAVSSSV